LTECLNITGNELVKFKYDAVDLVKMNNSYGVIAVQMECIRLMHQNCVDFW